MARKHGCLERPDWRIHHGPTAKRGLRTWRRRVTAMDGGNGGKRRSKFPPVVRRVVERDERLARVSQQRRPIGLAAYIYM